MMLHCKRRKISFLNGMLILGSTNLYRVCYYKVYQDIQTDKPQKKGGQILCCHFGVVERPI